MARWGATIKVRRFYVPIPDVDSQTFDKDAILGKVKEAQNAMLSDRAILPAVDSKASRGCMPASR